VRNDSPLCQCTASELEKFRNEGFNSHLSLKKLKKACAKDKCDRIRKATKPVRLESIRKTLRVADDPWIMPMPQVPGANAGTFEVPYLTKSGAEHGCSPFVPVIRSSATPIKIGADWDNTQIWNNNWEGLLVSECHFRLKNGAWSDGGPFYVFKRSIDHGKSHYGTFYRNGAVWNGTTCGVNYIPTARWTGQVPPGFVPYVTARSAAHDYYAEAYRKARPGNPVASVGQFLIELRDLPQVPLKGLPRGFGSLMRRLQGRSVADLPAVLLGQLEAFRHLGGEYLNVVFGWKPFVNDLRKMYNLWQTIDKQIAKLIRENGKAIRRRCQVKDQKDVTQNRRSYPWAYADCFGAPPNWMDGYSVRTTTTRTIERVWFSGHYRYFITDPGSSQWTARARLALFGAFPTPDLLYSVLPWTWLLDWFANVGDIVSNLSPNAIDTLYCNRSFIMRHTVQEVTEQCDTWHSAASTWDSHDTSRYGYLGAQWSGFSGSFVSVDKTETKVRAVGGNPYGLNTQSTDLSPSQWSILAALGLSRAAFTIK